MIESFAKASVAPVNASFSKLLEIFALKCSITIQTILQLVAVIAKRISARATVD